MANSFQQKALFWSDRPSVVFVLVSFCALALFYLPFLSAQKCFYYTDTTFFLKPEAQYLRDSIFAGTFPLWNRFNYCGMPQIAVTFPSLFYLPDWLLILFPFSVGLAISMVFHQMLAAVGAYALLKSFESSAKAASLGAVIVAFSGYSFSLVSNHSLVAGTAWCVMALAAFRFLEVRTRQSNFWKMIFAALATSFLIYSGRPEIIAPSLILLVAFQVWRACRRHLESSSGPFDEVSKWQLRALFIGTCLAMPQLLPVAEWLAVSRRSSGLQPGEIYLYSATWYDLVSSVIGPALGDLRLQSTEFRPLVEFASLPPFISCAYVGPFAMTLAFWGACDSRWKLRWTVLCTLVFSLLLCLGNNTPVLPFLVRWFPLLGVVRFPIKWFFLVVFCIALMAARGIDSLARGHLVHKLSAFLWTILAALFFALLTASNQSEQFLPFNQTSLAPEFYLKAEKLIALSGITTAITGLAISIAAMIMRKLDPEDKALANALVMMTGASLFYSAFNLEQSGAPSDFWDKPSYAADQIHALEKQDSLAENSRVLNLCLERFTIPPTYLQQEANPHGVGLNYQYDRQVLKPNSNIEFNIPETLGFEGTASGDYFYTGVHSYLLSNQSNRPESIVPSSFPLSRFCALTSTEYVITQKYRLIGHRTEVALLDAKLFKLRHESESMNLRIYKVLKTLPRCYQANVCRFTKNHNEVLESILQTDMNGFDPTLMTFIEADQAGAEKQLPNNNAQEPSVSSMKDMTPVITDDKAEHVRIETSSKYPTTLVLTDRSYAGWDATLDGVRVPILIANGFVRAVEIPTAGRHTVDFMYEPKSLKLGILIFGLAALLVLLLGLPKKTGSAV